MQDSSPGFNLSGTACALARVARVIYGALPVQCRNVGRAPDVAAEMYFIGYSALWAVLILWLSDAVAPVALCTSVDVVLSAPGVVAKVLCTGLGYALFQVGISPDIAGTRIGPSCAGLLFWVEPITANPRRASFSVRRSRSTAPFLPQPS